jgi:hypothetical protein
MRQHNIFCLYVVSGVVRRADITPNHTRHHVYTLYVICEINASGWFYYKENLLCWTAVGRSTFDVSFTHKKCIGKYAVRWENFSVQYMAPGLFRREDRRSVYFIASFNDALIYSVYTMLTVDELNMGS